MGLCFAQAALEWPLVVLCSVLVGAFLLVDWLSEPVTQETLRNIRSTVFSSSSPMEKLGVTVVLLLQQVTPLRKMMRLAVDAICVAVVVAVLFG